VPRRGASQPRAMRALARGDALQDTGENFQRRVCIGRARGGARWCSSSTFFAKQRRCKHAERALASAERGVEHSEPRRPRRGEEHIAAELNVNEQHHERWERRRCAVRGGSECAAKTQRFEAARSEELLPRSAALSKFENGAAGSTRRGSLYCWLQQRLDERARRLDGGGRCSGAGGACGEACGEACWWSSAHRPEGDSLWTRAFK